MRISYDRYLDKIHGGWMGKCVGGALGTPYEGFKLWQRMAFDEAFPEKVPPNDDLDLQVLWLGVLEERGTAIDARDLTDAWISRCWYPFNEYGNGRRNWRSGIAPPASGTFRNRFFDTGEGCPIRAEIWGYIFPGAPEEAARYAEMDGRLDHGPQSVGAEMMWAAMAADAFAEGDVRTLLERHMGHLPAGTTIATLAEAAIRAFDEGLTLSEARQRLLMLHGHPEACDARLNTAFAILGLLYGKGDLERTLLACLSCGYDTDCTLATAGALVGQIAGAARIDPALSKRIGDELVMGIAYRRPEMTVSALARDTARIGCLFAKATETGVEITDAPELAPLPAARPRPGPTVGYETAPECAMGETVRVNVISTAGGLSISPVGNGWKVRPGSDNSSLLSAPRRCEAWADTHRFVAADEEGQTEFGVAGAAPWIFLGAYFDATPPWPDEKPPGSVHDVIRRTGVSGQAMMNEHFLDIATNRIGEPEPDVPALWRHWARILARPPVVWAREDRMDPGDLIGLEGVYTAYLLRELICPDDRQVWCVCGNNDGFRLWVDGQLIADVDEQRWWTPYAHVYKILLHKGINPILLQLHKRGERVDFQMGFRHVGTRGAFNGEDWCVDLASADPFRHADAS